MKDITEDYCDFETAKLLREKGFDEKTSHVYYYYEEDDGWTFEKLLPGDKFDKDKMIHCPTQALAMKWIRERHGYVISIEYQPECNTFKWRIYKYDTTTSNPEKHTNFEHYHIFEECVEAVINYSLKYLI